MRSTPLAHTATVVTYLLIQFVLATRLLGIVVTWSCTIRKYFPWIPNQLSVPLRFIQLQCQVLPRLGPHVVKNTA